MSGLPFPYLPQESEYAPTQNPAPTIVPTIQPTPVANVATDVSNILPQILTSMQLMQQLLINMQTNQTGWVGQTSNRNNHTHQAATEPRQGQQPHNLLPDFANTHISGHMGSVHMKYQRATIKLSSTRIPQPSQTSAVEAHMSAPENGGRQA